MIQVVLKYKNYLNSIDKHILRSKFKPEYIINEMNLSRATYYRKLRDKSFTVEEMIKLSKILYPKESNAITIEEAFNNSINGLNSVSGIEIENLKKDFKQRIKEILL